MISKIEHVLIINHFPFVEPEIPRKLRNGLSKWSVKQILIRLLIHLTNFGILLEPQYWIKMNVNDEYNVAIRYRNIRKHLDSLGYKQGLSLDALPLIEKLLADLIQTTDSLKHFKAIAHDNVEVIILNSISQLI